MSARQPRQDPKSAADPVLADATRKLAQLRALAASYGYPLFTLDRMALRVEEVAGTLGLSKSTVRNLIRDGELASVRVRDAVLVPTTDLLAFLEAHRSSPQRTSERIADELARSLLGRKG